MKGDFTRFTFDPKKRYTNVLKQQGRVDLDADWNEQSAIDTYLDRISRMDLSGMESGAPSLEPGFEVTVAPKGNDLNISAGRFYAKGIICELFQDTTYLTQPFPPSNPPPFTLVPAGGRTDSVYLDVWQRHITAIEDPSIKEIALGGPDTATRVQTIFQIRIKEKVDAVDCPTAPPLPAPSGAQMSSSLVPVPPEDDLCLIGATGGYRGLENRLYRVEIHTPGALGTATFKWSRDNGSVVFPISEFVPGQPTKIRVTRLGRDQVLSLHEGDWVEVLDDNIELGGTPGTIAQIQNIDPANRELTLSVAVSGSMTAHPKVRRWDQKSAPIVTSATPIPLEDGIQVSFGGSNFKTGDFWMFAARATDGTIETLTNQAAQGIDHVYAQLAIVTWTSSTTATVHDCRNIFPSPGGGDCCCTVCVSADDHNSGKLSLQTAINNVIKAGGGTICLGIGKYDLKRPLRIEKAMSLRIVGKGRASQLSSGFTAIVEIIGGNDVNLESFSVLCHGNDKGPGSAVLVRSLSQVCLEGLAIEFDEDSYTNWSAIGLSGALMGVVIRDNAITAPAGIVNIADEKATGLMDLRIEDNQFYCDEVAIKLTGVSVLQQVSRIAGNRVSPRPRKEGMESSGPKVGFELTGATVPGFGIEVTGNELQIVEGDGIIAAVDGLRIVDNDLILLRKTAVDKPQRGIVLTKGMITDGKPDDRLDDCQIVGNRIVHRTQNNKIITVFDSAILAEVALGAVTVARNQIQAAGTGVQVGTEKKPLRIESLTIDYNQMSAITKSAIDVTSEGGRVAACGNQLQIVAEKNTTGVNITFKGGDCVYSDNHSHHREIEGTVGVKLVARTLVVASNRIVGRVPMNLQPDDGSFVIQQKKGTGPLCTVLGNITDGLILVGSNPFGPPSKPLEPPWDALNLQNVV